MMQIIASSQLIIIIGLGVTGMSAARFLAKRSIRFVMMDSRENPPNYEQFCQEFPNIKCITGCLDQELLVKADEIIVSPGVNLQTPELTVAVDAGVSIIGDIELFARYVTKPVIAITGSNAKSTVTTLVGEMAKAQGYSVGVGGNLGVPVLDMLEGDSFDYFVLELSSFQLESTFSLSPKVATILNISEDHLDRHGSLQAYHQAKQRIYRHAENIVINRQDVLTQPPIANNVTVWSFGNDKPDVKGFGLVKEKQQYHLYYQFTQVAPANELNVKGKHNYMNALAALAIGTAAEFDLTVMIEVLKAFRGLPHRCEYIKTVDHVVYINDSKATNVGATLAAIDGFADENKKNIVLIAGGQGKGADFSILKSAVKKAVHHVILIGEDAGKLALALGGITEVVNKATLREAVSAAKDYASPGDIVLLSPACASFDMFSGFAQRGEQFAALVQEVAA